MDNTILLIVAGAGILIGILIGLLMNALRGDSSRRSPAGTERATGSIDNILLWHDRQGGNLIVDLDGSTFTSVAQMHPEQRSRLETCYGQLKRFLNIQETATVQESSQTGARPIPLPVADTPSPIPSQQQKSMPSSAPAPVQSDQKPTEGKKGKPEPIKPLSIVEEIDDILQDMIAWTGLATRGLRLVETPEHTMSVILDVKQYQSIDEVPEPEVQEILREAVKRWEKKNS